MGMLGFVPFSGLRDHGGGGMSFDPNSPDYGVFRNDGIRERERDVSPSSLFDDWKYLLSGDWVKSGFDDFFNNVVPEVNERLEQTLDQGGTDNIFLKHNSANPVSGNRLNPDTFEYLNAELSKFYGMDRNTAFQEALANTAYQRAVKDMKAAGLNPASIFGAGRGSTAGGVAFIGNSNSASGYSSGSGSLSNSKLFERDTYGMIAALSGLATAIVTKRPQNFWLGQQASQGIMQTLNVLDRKFNR